MDNGSNNQMTKVYNSLTYNAKSKLIMVLFGIAVAIGAVALVASINKATGMGILDVTASDAKAKLSVEDTSGKMQSIGAGHTSARLTPGTYQVHATSQDGETSMPATINKGKTTSAKLTVQKSAPIQKVIDYSAKSIYQAPDGSLYFINTKDRIFNRYTPGETSAKAYLTDNNTLVQAYWISPTQVFFKKEDDSWTALNNGQKRSVQFAGKAPVADSISFNQSGAYAFVTDNNDIAFASGIGQPLQKIGATVVANAQTSVAPNGIVLVSSRPTDNHTRPNTRLYKGKDYTELPQELASITSVVWAPDSTKFSYTTPDGIFVYDLAAKSTSKALAGTPDDPRGMNWFSSNVLLYTYKGAIWKYEAGSTSTKVANIEGIVNAPQPFVLASDGQTIYFGTSPSDEGKGGNLYRVMPNFYNLSSDKQQVFLNAQNQVAQSEPTYNGIEALTDTGLTTDQHTNLKYAFNRFAKTAGISLGSVSISNVNAIPRNRNSASTINTYTFNAAIGGITYAAKLETSDLTTVRLYLYLSKDSQITFDSGNISDQN